MATIWEVEFTNEFNDFWDELSEGQQLALGAVVRLLQRDGPNLRRPHVGNIRSSRHAPQMKELICSSEGALRVLFVFDPRRTAILLLGGDKSGLWDRWYDQFVPIADNLYDEYLRELRAEKLI